MRLGLVCTLVTAAAISACGSSGGATASSSPTPSRPVPTSTSTRAVTPSPTIAPAVTRPPVDPGTLPQTSASPAATSPAWRERTAALWTAIRTGNPQGALPAFFPLAAYRQIKAISDPVGDWNNRLVHLYDLDIAALHAWLGPHAASAQLVSVDVPADGTWVLPGQEYNSGSYWRVYGTRVHVLVDGQQRSFGIASLISWRGEWYIVHLGPITRDQPVGMVLS